MQRLLTDLRAALGGIGPPAGVRRRGFQRDLRPTLPGILRNLCRPLAPLYLTRCGEAQGKRITGIVAQDIPRLVMGEQRHTLVNRLAQHCEEFIRDLPWVGVPQGVYLILDRRLRQRRIHLLQLGFHRWHQRVGQCFTVGELLHPDGCVPRLRLVSREEPIPSSGFGVQLFNREVSRLISHRAHLSGGERISLLLPHDEF